MKLRKENLDNREVSVKIKDTTAMKELSDHTDIIISQVDKGGAVVIMDVKDYINETSRLLTTKITMKQ